MAVLCVPLLYFPMRAPARGFQDAWCASKASQWHLDVLTSRVFCLYSLRTATVFECIAAGLASRNSFMPALRDPCAFNVISNCWKLGLVTFRRARAARSDRWLFLCIRRNGGQLQCAHPTLWGLLCSQTVIVTCRACIFFNTLRSLLFCQERSVMLHLHDIRDLKYQPHSVKVKGTVRKIDGDNCMAQVKAKKLANYL